MRKSQSSELEDCSAPRSLPWRPGNIGRLLGRQRALVEARSVQHGTAVKSLSPLCESCKGWGDCPQAIVDFGSGANSREQSKGRDSLTGAADLASKSAVCSRARDAEQEVSRAADIKARPSGSSGSLYSLPRGQFYVAVRG